MFKKIIKILFLFLIVAGGVLFFGLKKVQAADYQLVVNEVMANPQGTDTNHEWIELFNYGTNDINLENWQIKIFNDPLVTTPTKTITFNPGIISAGGYLVIVNNAANFTPCSSCSTFDGGSYTITNSKGKIDLVSADKTYQNEFSWTADVGDGHSMEIVGSPSDTSYSQWLKGINIGGTPGEQNSISKIPKAPVLALPADNLILNDRSLVNFLWSGDINLTYQFILSSNSNLSDPIIVEPNLTSENYKVEGLDYGKYFWQVIASNGGNESRSEVNSFTIDKKIYSNSIIINEICPHPENGTDYEFIELYNSGGENVDLSGWFLDDSDGGSNPYEIPIGTTILPSEYKVFYRSETGITLNDTGGDAARLFNPKNELVSSTSYNEYASLGLAWARGPDGVWAWTDNPTASGQNIIHLDDGLGGSGDDIDINQPVNSEPIEIGTGDFVNYENYLVTVMGEVTETSGDTFYLDDGSGVVKIYIQKKTGIDKPEMHKGDIFLITGIVDLYGTTWRILPRTADDIRLVESKITVTKNATKKKTTSVTGKTLSSISSKNLLGEAKAVSSNNKNSNENPTKSSTLIQLIELFTSLSIIFMILLVTKVLRMPKKKIIGGNFGEDET